jgi:PP-loop superfamily ATP-utilizing enzyme
VAEMKRLGFSYVTVDLQGFRSGSMNEPLSLA